MIRFPTLILERTKIPRIIFSIRSSKVAKISSLMKKCYERGAWCFDLPSPQHLETFHKLKQLINDETLMGLCHVEAEEGVSLAGKPLHQFELKVVSTIIKNIVPRDLVRYLFPAHSSYEVLTQKEIDRITFDSGRFDRAISRFTPKDSPFLLLGEKYGDWLLALGRIDPLKEMVSRIRENGFIPIFSGQWATYVLPKAKPLDVAAYAIPINKKWSLFDFTRACDLIKKFDKPVISLNPLAGGELLRKSEEAFAFLFEGLKIYAAIAEITSEEEFSRIAEVLEKVPPLIPLRKT
ncbi:MAG: hypothetical protein A2169_05550 [Deltaproteobacteria bacterium RBG_13_47_9]|nr:MAG: hypothetical protein A2169_05550 [Deltaproteobacteria bacterium RBG_13_47_9]